jgi:hypothetical protein
MISRLLRRGLTLGLILLTCACAAALNYSGIALIGRINPIAFQFVNQLRTVLIVSVGFRFSDAARRQRCIVRFLSLAKRSVVITIIVAVCIIIIVITFLHLRLPSFRGERLHK